MMPLPSLDDHYLRKLFEHVAYGFYRHRLTFEGWTVRHGVHLKWDISRASPGMAAILPGMELDIERRHPDPSGAGSRRVVIDTKFTSVTKAGQFGKPTLSSGYVYQIYGYLMSQDAHELGPKSEGLMLHPSVGDHVDEEVVIQGHRFRFVTVDLAADPKTIAGQLRAAVSETVKQ